MARAAIPHLLAQRWGRLINISINHETMGRAGFSPYGPSKAALEAATAAWARELDGTGVTVNALLPGGITDTAMVPDAAPEKVRLAMLDPAIMVAPALWLCSPTPTESAAGESWQTGGIHLWGEKTTLWAARSSHCDGPERATARLCGGLVHISRRNSLDRVRLSD